MAGLPRLAELTISGGSLGFRRLPNISKAFEVLSFDLLELIVCSFLSLMSSNRRLQRPCEFNSGLADVLFVSKQRQLPSKELFE